MRIPIFIRVATLTEGKESERLRDGLVIFLFCGRSSFMAKDPEESMASLRRSRRKRLLAALLLCCGWCAWGDSLDGWVLLMGIDGCERDFSSSGENCWFKLTACVCDRVKRIVCLLVCCLSGWFV